MVDKDSIQNTMQTMIESKLQQAFSPHKLQIINESYLHNVPDGAESHFKVLIVSDAFSELRQIQRQQQVYHVLAEEMAGSIHALTMQTLTTAEWQVDQTVTASPECMGGSKG
ncbi:MAG: BolA protein [Kiritimatiellia bacterium]